MTALRNSLGLHSSKYEKILILGDFNVEMEVANLKSFCKNFNLKNLMKQTTCYKTPNKPTCIDLILTSFPRIFENTYLETGLSDFHLMKVTIMRKNVKEGRPRVIIYRS